LTRTFKPFTSTSFKRYTLNTERYHEERVVMGKGLRGGAGGAPRAVKLVTA